MNKSNDELIIWVIIAIAASGIFCSYFLRPDYYPSNLDFIGSLGAGFKNFNSWISITLYALLATVISLFCSAVLLFGVLKSEDGKNLNYFFIFFMVVVTTAVIKFSNPVAPLKNLSGIWKEENTHNRGVAMIDLSNTKPIFAFSRNENEFAAGYTKVEKIDSENNNVTVSISATETSKSKLFFTLSGSETDGHKKILITSSDKPDTLIFIRPIVNSDYENIIKAEDAGNRDAVLLNNCKVEIHNRNKNIIFYDEAPDPIFEKTINSQVFKGDNGHAVLIFSGLPPSQDHVLGQSKVIKCTFSEDFKKVSLTTCNKPMSECD